MIKYPLLLVIFFTLFFSFQNSNAVPIMDLFTQYNEERLILYPFDATAAGDDRYNDSFPNNIAQSFKAKEKKFYTKYKLELEKFDRSSLSVNQRTSYDILQWECDIHLASQSFPTELIPVNQFSSTHLMIGQLASGSSFQPFKTIRDYENWLHRLEGFVTWTDTAMANMKKGMKQGYVLPKALAQKMAPQFAGFAVPIKENLFYSPIKSIPENFSDAQKLQIDEAYKTIIKNKIIPTFKRFYEFLKTEYIPACHTGSGIGNLPNGLERYNHLIKHYTTTELSADEIHQIGLSEVRRIS